MSGQFWNGPCFRVYRGRHVDGVGREALTRPLQRPASSAPRPHHSPQSERPIPVATLSSNANLHSFRAWDHHQPQRAKIKGEVAMTNHAPGVEPLGAQGPRPPPASGVTPSPRSDSPPQAIKQPRRRGCHKSRRQGGESRPLDVRSGKRKSRMLSLTCNRSCPSREDCVSLPL